MENYKQALQNLESRMSQLNEAFCTCMRQMESDPFLSHHLQSEEQKRDICVQYLSLLSKDIKKKGERKCIMFDVFPSTPLVKVAR